MADEIRYTLDSVAATSVAADQIDSTFRSNSIGECLFSCSYKNEISIVKSHGVWSFYRSTIKVEGGGEWLAEQDGYMSSLIDIFVNILIELMVPDLVSATLGGRVLSYSNQWFAEASNLLTPTAPIRAPGKMVYSGAWYDGWETRRHNPEPFDFVVIRLGVASGIVTGVEIDTAHFSGNEAPAISVEGCFSENDNEVVGWKGQKGGWETVLGVQPCGPSQRHGWKLGFPSKKAYTHVRLNMYPDGGIARFRLFGHAVPVFPEDKDAIFDLAAAQNGGVAVSCSDQHFGTKDNLLLPGRGKDMGDGWETSRSRGKGHVDWTVVKLGASGTIARLIVDTAHFRGNFPQKILVQALHWTGEGEPGSLADGWADLIAVSKGEADKELEYTSLVQDKVFTHVKLVIIPDGGVKRIRVFGKRL